MSYNFQGVLYNTSKDALEAIAVAWVYGGAERPYHDTLKEAPAKLAAECVQAWGLRALLAEMGENEAALAGAIEEILFRALAVLD